MRSAPVSFRLSRRNRKRHDTIVMRFPVKQNRVYMQSALFPGRIYYTSLMTA